MSLVVELVQVAISDDLTHTDWQEPRKRTGRPRPGGLTLAALLMRYLGEFVKDCHDVLVDLREYHCARNDVPDQHPNIQVLGDPPPTFALAGSTEGQPPQTGTSAVAPAAYPDQSPAATTLPGFSP
jgi:hypothetical protein